MLAALEALDWVAALRASRWTYPLVAAGHLIGVALTFGAILPLDLRLLGVGRARADALAAACAPVAAVGVALAVATGAALFATRATEYAANGWFLAKVGLAGLAILNALALRRTPAWRRLGAGGGPRLAVAAGASILLWTAAIVAGRMIAYA